MLNLVLRFLALNPAKYKLIMFMEKQNKQIENNYK